jgi:NAD/NADP transhydrogenase beta subunit
MNLELLNLESVRALYIVSAVLFILTLGGLSNQESSRQGNLALITWGFNRIDTLEKSTND